MTEHKNRRIVPRDAIGPAIRAEKSKDPRHTCTRTIRLDGRLYRCGCEVLGIDRDHGGVHDAFEVHGDQGAVRW